MQFMIKAYDGEDMLEKRMAVRPRHLEGMKRLGKQIICAGGLLDDEGQMKGSALVLDFPDRAALDEYLASEPYVVEGVWEKIEIEPMNVVLVKGKKTEKYTYITQGVCAKKITFELEEGMLHNVKCHGGCPGNASAIGKLLEGADAQNTVSILKGNVCGGRGTSCADQLAIAVEEVLNMQAKGSDAF